MHRSLCVHIDGNFYRSILALSWLNWRMYERFAHFLTLQPARCHQWALAGKVSNSQYGAVRFYDQTLWEGGGRGWPMQKYDGRTINYAQ